MLTWGWGWCSGRPIPSVRFLILVADEVDFGLGRFDGWGWLDLHLRLGLGLLEEDVDKRLLLWVWGQLNLNNFQRLSVTDQVIIVNFVLPLVVLVGVEWEP